MNVINYIFGAYKKNQIYILICLILFLISFIFGTIFCDSLCNSFIIINIEEYNLFFDTSISLSSYFFSKFFSILGLLLLISLSGITVYLLPIHCLIIIYQGLIMGCVAVSLYCCYSILGVVVFILVLVPSFLLRILAIILLSALNFLTASKASKCGKINFFELGLNFLIALIVVLIALFWELIILGIIIRPISIYF